MTLILVDPKQNIVAADTRLTYGDQYRDNHRKLHRVGDFTVTGNGSGRHDYVGRDYIWRNWSNKRAMEMHALANHLHSELGDNMGGSLIVAGHGSAFEIDPAYGIFPINAASSFGSGDPFAQTLLLHGVPFHEIFRLVSACCWSVSPNYHLEHF